jgi:hypothetical protein
MIFLIPYFFYEIELSSIKFLYMVPVKFVHPKKDLEEIHPFSAAKSSHKLGYYGRLSLQA